MPFWRKDSDRKARERLARQLAALPVFAGMPEHVLRDLAAQGEIVRLQAGAVLFSQGEPSDALYCLLHGRLLAQRQEANAVLRPLGSVAPGETVGETGVLLEEPRSATVHALRDSELLRLPVAAFGALIAQHPQPMLRMARVALRRFQAQRQRPALPSCFAVLAAHAGPDLHGFARRLCAALDGAAETCVIDAALGAAREPAWFAEREAQARHLIYVGDGHAAWRTRCAGLSDCVLLLADGSREPGAVGGLVESGATEIPHQLVLLHDGQPHAGRTRRWRAALPQTSVHHHVRDETDVLRMARRLSGRATGLVLSGGGARGFAQLGVLRALHEHGFHFDYVGGASIGAIIGAGVAAGWTLEHMSAVYRAQFVDTDPLSDWTLPLLALRRGRKVSRLLREAFGERDIEDLPLPFYCVSTDLNAGATAVHESGPLWQWLRASSAIPGVLPPVFCGGRVLVDGGVIDNLPVGAMRRRLAGGIVAVDVGGDYRLETTLEETESPGWWRLLADRLGPRVRPSMGQILWRAGMVNSAATVLRRRQQTRLLIAPRLAGIDLLDWRAFDRAIELGYAHAKRQLAEGT